MQIEPVTIRNSLAIYAANFYPVRELYDKERVKEAETVVEQYLAYDDAVILEISEYIARIDDQPLALDPVGDSDELEETEYIEEQIQSEARINEEATTLETQDNYSVVQNSDSYDGLSAGISQNASLLQEHFDLNGASTAYGRGAKSFTELEPVQQVNAGEASTERYDFRLHSQHIPDNQSPVESLHVIA